MLRETVRPIFVLGIVLALVVSPIAGITGSGVAQTTSPKTYSVTEHVSVWERAPLPFRLDSDDAAKTITNGALDINYKPAGSGPVSARLGKTAVYQPGDKVSATFKTVTGADASQFNGQSTQLVVARLNPNTSAADGGTLDMIPTSLGEAKDFFDTEDANDNATFTQLKTPGSITDGALSTSVTFSDSGTYAIFLVTGTQLSISNGDLSVNGDTTIVGMDAAVVEESPADASPTSSTVTRGNDVSFTVTPKTSGTTNVSILLYDESKWENSHTTVVVNEPISTDLAAEDITIKHDIEKVNGVADFDGSVSMLGLTTTGERRAGTFTAASIIDFLVTTANEESSQSINQPKSEVTEPSKVIDASIVTKANISGTTTIDVPTFEDWANSDYRYIVVTGGNNAQDIHTKEGKVLITKADTGDGDGDTGDGGIGDGIGGGDPGEDDGDAPVPGKLTGVADGSEIRKTATGTIVEIAGTTAGTPVQVDFTVSDAELTTTGVALTSLQFTPTGNIQADLNITTIQTVDVPPVAQGGDLGYVRIEENVDPSLISGATYTFAVRNTLLETHGVAPENVAVYRYQDGGWNQLDTQLTSSQNNVHRYEADSPGLSLYAISTKDAGQAQADITVANADLSTTSVHPGESVDVTATLENTGDAEGTFDATLQINGNAIASKQVTVPAGETKQVTFSHTFDTTGDFEVAISGTTAGTVSVTQEDTTTTTTSSTTPPGGEDDKTGGGGNLFLYSFIVLLLIVIPAATIYLYKEGYFDDYLNDLNR